MSNELGIIVGAGGLAISLLVAVIAYFSLKSAKDSVVKTNGKHEGVVLTELGYIKKGIEEIKTEQKEQSQFNADLLIRVSHVERDAQAAHRRLDRLKIPSTFEGGKDDE